MNKSGSFNGSRGQEDMTRRASVSRDAPVSPCHLLMLKVRTLVKGIVGVALCSVILFFPMAVISWTVEWLTGPRRISGLWWWGAWLAASDLLFWMLHRADRSTGASVTSAAKHLAWL